MRLRLALLSLTVFRFAAPSEETPLLPPRAIVAALDEQLQLRFVDDRSGFGFERLCRPMTHRSVGLSPDNCINLQWSLFQPRNQQETWVQREANRANIEVLTFLTGKNTRLHGPLALTNDPHTDLTRLRRLVIEARKSHREEAIDDWQVIVRPVRASRKSCLECHQGLRVGDAIADLIYLYRRASV